MTHDPDPARTRTRTRPGPGPGPDPTRPELVKFFFCFFLRVRDTPRPGPDPARPELVKNIFFWKRLGITCGVPWSSRRVQVRPGRPRFFSRQLEIPASPGACLTEEKSAFPGELECRNPTMVAPTTCSLRFHTVFFLPVVSTASRAWTG